MLYRQETLFIIGRFLSNDVKFKKQYIKLYIQSDHIILRMTHRNKNKIHKNVRN